MTGNEANANSINLIIFRTTIKGISEHTKQDFQDRLQFEGNNTANIDFWGTYKSMPQLEQKTLKCLSCFTDKYGNYTLLYL